MIPAWPNVSLVWGGWTGYSSLCPAGQSQYSVRQSETPHLQLASRHQQTGPAEQQTPLFPLPSSLNSLHTTLFSVLNVILKSPHNFHQWSIISTSCSFCYDKLCNKNSCWFRFLRFCRCEKWSHTSRLDPRHQRYRVGLKMGPSAHCRVPLRKLTSDLDSWDWGLSKNVLTCSDLTTGSWETAEKS